MHNYSEKFEKMKIAGNLAARTLDMLTDYIKPGITTNYIDKLGYEFIKDNGGHSAPLFYRGFPKSVCTSANHIVCHGIPSEKILDKGDIINIDVTVILNGWYGDTSRMFIVGDSTSVKAKKLIEITYMSLMEGIKKVKPGIALGDIGYLIEKLATQNNFSVVKDFCGHGIGKNFHEAPSVLHYGSKGEGLKLKEGMIFTIEPMLNAGTNEIKILGDGWTAITKDRKLSAQFEHTIGVTKNGYEIFTLSPKDFHKPPYWNNKKYYNIK